MTFDSVFISFVNRSITASYIILIIILLRCVMKKLPKSFSFYLWAIAGFRLLCPITISSAFSLFNLHFFDKVKSGNSPSLQHIPQQVHKADTIINYSVPAQTHPMASNLAAQASTDIVTEILNLGAYIWFAGIVILLLLILASYLKMRKKVEESVLLTDNIFQCCNISSPFVFGFWRPRIYIPFHLKEEEQDYIIVHERYHISRRDYLTILLAQLTLIVYWFNPFIWLAFFFMKQDMEMSCDERVLKELGYQIKKDYSRSLLSFAVNRRQPFINTLSFGESNTKKRVKNILHYKQPKKWIAFIVFILLVITSALCLTNGKEIEGTDKEKQQEQVKQEEQAKKEEQVKQEEEKKKENMQNMQNLPERVTEIDSDKTNSADDSNTTKTADLFKIMDRIVQADDKALTWEENLKNKTTEDRMVILAESPDKNIIAYGCVSSVYGNCGVIIDYKIKGQSNHNYFEYSWEPAIGSVQLIINDYDKDGNDEIALILTQHPKTNVSNEKLIVFEANETGTLNPTEYDDTSLITEMIKQKKEETIVEIDKSKETEKVTVK